MAKPMTSNYPYTVPDGTANNPAAASWLRQAEQVDTDLIYVTEVARVLANCATRDGRTAPGITKIRKTARLDGRLIGTALGKLTAAGLLVKIADADQCKRRPITYRLTTTSRQGFANDHTSR